MLFIVFSTVLFFSFTLSKALISIAFTGICVLGLIHLFTQKFTPKEKIISFVFILFYVFIIVSFFTSTNKDEALQKLVLKIPILLMPLALMAVKNIRKNTFTAVVSIFNYALFIPAFVSVYNYLINKKLFDDLILQSKPLPIEFGYGIYHIQFSIILALAVLFGVFKLYNLAKTNKINEWFYVLLFLTSFNFIFIHILSARTGLLALYIGFFIFVIQFFAQIKLANKLKLIAVCIAIPTLLFLFSSSLQNRVTNTIADFKVVLNNANANDYSFAMRVKAWKNAINVIENNVLMGVGIGDANNVLEKNFEITDASILPQNRRNPHFQLLETWVQSGIFAASCFMAIFILVFFKFKESFNWQLLAIALLLFVASCFESILERQSTVVAFSFFIALAFSKPNSIQNDSD